MWIPHVNKNTTQIQQYLLHNQVILQARMASVLQLWHIAIKQQISWPCTSLSCRSYPQSASPSSTRTWAPWPVPWAASQTLPWADPKVEYLNLGFFALRSLGEEETVFLSFLCWRLLERKSWGISWNNLGQRKKSLYNKAANRHGHCIAKSFRLFVECLICAISGLKKSSPPLKKWWTMHAWSGHS